MENIVRFFIRMIIPVLIFVVLGFLINSIKKDNSNELIKNLKKEHVIIHLPKAYFYIGLVGFLFFGICTFVMYYYPNNTTSVWVWIIFVLFDSIGFFIMLLSQIWKIEVFADRDYFLYRNSFFKTHRIQYIQCISYEITTNNVVLKTSRRKFHIDSNATNIEILLNFLIKNNVKEISR